MVLVDYPRNAGGDSRQKKYTDVADMLIQSLALLCLFLCLHVFRLLDVLVRQMGRASANVQKRNESLGINDSLFTFVTDESKPREGEVKNFDCYAPTYGLETSRRKKRFECL